MGKSVFISYSHSDSHIAVKVEKALKHARHRPILDMRSFKTYERLQSAIHSRIKRSDYFLLIWSSSARQSDWVNQELGSALALKKPIITLKVGNSRLPGAIADRIYYSVDEARLDDQLKDWIEELWPKQELYKKVGLFIALLLFITFLGYALWPKRTIEPISKTGFTVLLIPPENDSTCQFSKNLKHYLEQSSLFGADSIQVKLEDGIKGLLSTESATLAAQSVQADMVVWGTIDLLKSKRKLILWHKMLNESLEQANVSGKHIVNFESVLEVFETGSELNNDIDYLLKTQLGFYEINRGNYQVAVRHFLSLENRFKDDPALAIQTGLAYHFLGDTVSAEKHYRSVLKMKPCIPQVNVVKYFFNRRLHPQMKWEPPVVQTARLGSFEYGQKPPWSEDSWCISLFDSLDSFYRQYFQESTEKQRYHILAVFHAVLNYDLDKAQEYYEQYLSKYPASARVYNALGLFNKKRGDISKALHYHRLSFQLESDSWINAMQLGKLYMGNPSIPHHLDSAIKYFKTAIDISDIHSDTYHELGNIYLFKSDCDSAKHFYYQALSIANRPELLGEIHFDIARVEKICGNCKAATSHWELAFKANPELKTRDTGMLLGKPIIENCQ